MKGISLKKIITLYIVLLCAVCASASPIHVTGTVNYGTAYRGSGRMYTTSSARLHSMGGSGMAQAPTASMSSTSRGITTTAAVTSVSAPRVACIRTTASSIRGGVTTYDEGPRMGHIKKDGEPPLPPGACGNCKWVWDDEKDDYVCVYCGCEAMDGCDCTPECHCPINDGADVWMLVAAMAVVYAAYKSVNKRKDDYATTTD